MAFFCFGIMAICKNKTFIRRVCGKSSSRSNYYIVKGLTGQWWRHSKLQLYACFASEEGSWLKRSPAGMNRAHGRWGKVWVVFNGDGLLHMVLADVLIHLLHSQRLPVLKKPNRFRSLAPHQFLTMFTMMDHLLDLNTAYPWRKYIPNIFYCSTAAITVTVDLFFISTINILIKLEKIKSNMLGHIWPNMLLATFQQYLNKIISFTTAVIKLRKY